MTDDLSTHSVTLFDRFTEHRELKAQFMPNEVAIAVGEVGPTSGCVARITLARDQVRELRDHCTRWLGE